MALQFTPEFLQKFEIHGLLGEGGMGVVYRATQRSLDRMVAVKFLQGTSDSEEFRRRFELEAKTAAQIFHTHLVAVIEFGHMGEYPYIVFEFVDGPSLRSVLKEGPIRPLSRVLELVRQAALGLGRAHSAGIIHRDVKPENLLLAGDVVKVADFGVAKVNDARGGKTGTGILLGTPAYMSPEQARERPLTAASDIYSLGVVLFELVNGELPFVAPSALEVLSAHVTAPLPPMVAGVPDEVRRIIDKALAKAPEERFASMDEFAAQLLAVVTTVPATDREAVARASRKVETVAVAAVEVPKRITGKHRATTTSKQVPTVRVTAPDRTVKWAAIGVVLALTGAGGLVAYMRSAMRGQTVTIKAESSVETASAGASSQPTEQSWEALRARAFSRIGPQMNQVHENNAMNHLSMTYQALMQPKRLTAAIESYGKWCAAVRESAEQNRLESQLILQELTLRIIEDERILSTVGRSSLTDTCQGPFQEYVSGVVALISKNFTMSSVKLDTFLTLMGTESSNNLLPGLLAVVSHLCAGSHGTPNVLGPKDPQAVTNYMNSDDMVLFRPIARIAFKPVMAYTGMDDRRAEALLKSRDPVPVTDLSPAMSLLRSLVAREVQPDRL